MIECETQQACEQIATHQIKGVMIGIALVVGLLFLWTMCRNYRLSQQRNSEQKYPTPTFDRGGIAYVCSADCTNYVDPKAGDKECALMIAGRQRKVCEECLEDALNFLNEREVVDGE